MNSLKDEFIETMMIFFDIVVLNQIFYLITFTSFGFLLIPSLFIFVNVVYRNIRKNTSSIINDLKNILTRDFYSILKHNAIQWISFVIVMLVSNNITITFIFLILILPYLTVFWFLLINRKLKFFEYYMVSLRILFGYPLLYLFMLLAIIITTYVIFFLNGFFLIVFAPIGFFFLLLFPIDKIILKLEGKNENN